MTRMVDLWRRSRLALFLPVVLATALGGCCAPEPAAMSGGADETARERVAAESVAVAEKSAEAGSTEGDSGIICFHGSTYEQDSFFWLIDTSATPTPVPLQALKDELILAIRALSRHAQFGVVSSAAGGVQFRDAPVYATAAEKEHAIAWINALTVDLHANDGSSWSLAPGAIQCLELTQSSRRRSKRMICLTGGGERRLRAADVAQINEANWQRTPIDVIFFGDGTEGARQMQALATANGGSFAQLQPEPTRSR